MSSRDPDELLTDAPTDVLTEVPVQAAVLRATAGLLELLTDFLTEADPSIRTTLGTYLVGRHSDASNTDPALETGIMLAELDDAAELLHALAGDYHPDNWGAQAQQ
jgi:hypothetical protein